jgi:hypothetical protein
MTVPVSRLVKFPENTRYGGEAAYPCTICGGHGPKLPTLKPSRFDSTVAFRTY